LSVLELHQYIKERKAKVNETKTRICSNPVLICFPYKPAVKSKSKGPI
jgi:hypothetical protein